MKWWRRILLVLVGCWVVGLLAALVRPGEAGPKCRGKRLSQWVRTFGSSPGGSPEEAEAAAALRQIGTNALPFLLEWLRYERPAWRDKLADALARSPGESQFLIAEWIRRRRSEVRADAAKGALRLLGRDCARLIPDLEAMALDPKRPQTGARAVDVLGDIGGEGLPALVALLTNAQAPTRLPAMIKIGNMGTNAAPALPVVVECLNDQSPILAGTAAWALGKLGLEPEQCVPAITNQLHRPGALYRLLALDSLAEFGERARAAVPSLIVALNDPDVGVRFAATNALCKIAPEVLPNGGGW